MLTRTTRPTRGVFLLYLGFHLERNGVDLRRVTWQTHNGRGLVGSWNRKREHTRFEEMAERFRLQTPTIGPGQCTYNKGVEALRRLMEDEFYDLEDYRKLKEFLNRATAYVAHLTYSRKFRYEQTKTPLKVLKETKKKP